MIVPLKYLMVACSILAAVSLIGSWLLLRAPDPDTYAWIPGVPVRFVCGACDLTCILLAVYGLVVHRVRGVWLLLPLVFVLVGFWVFADQFVTRICGPVDHLSCP